ncbi:unnamed protein product, partial [Symbiodinium sp. CCMP2456]
MDRASHRPRHHARGKGLSSVPAGRSTCRHRREGIRMPARDTSALVGVWQCWGQRDVQQMGRAEILQELAVFNGSIRFLPLDKSILALFTAFAKQRPLSEEFQPGVAEEYEEGSLRPLQLIGQMLQVLVLGSLLFIALLASLAESLARRCFLGEAASSARQQSSVRRFAEKASRRGPRALVHHPEGHNWIGGLDMIWTSPPMVRRVKPHLQQICEVKTGDRLVSVGDEPTESLEREEVLKLLSGRPSGLNFMSGE